VKPKLASTSVSVMQRLAMEMHLTRTLRLLVPPRMRAWNVWKSGDVLDSVRQAGKVCITSLVCEAVFEAAGQSCFATWLHDLMVAQEASNVFYLLIMFLEVLSNVATPSALPTRLRLVHAWTECDFSSNALYGNAIFLRFMFSYTCHSHSVLRFQFSGKAYQISSAA
jgi:hypothetical protein